MKPRYKVFDTYEEPEYLGGGNTMKEVKKIVRKRIKDTDDECQCVYAELDPSTNTYDWKNYKLMLIVR